MVGAGGADPAPGVAPDENAESMTLEDDGAADVLPLALATIKPNNFNNT